MSGLGWFMLGMAIGQLSLIALMVVATSWRKGPPRG